MTSREVSEWAAYLHWLDGESAGPPREPAPPVAPAGDDAAVSWQRLLSFADRANASHPGA